VWPGVLFLSTWFQRVTTLLNEKVALRQLAHGRRAKVSANRGAAAAAEIAALLCDSVPIPPAMTIAGFWPIGDEIDIRPALQGLFERGHDLALPVVIGRGRPLVFRAWRPGDALVTSVFGTFAPKSESPQIIPHALLVPALAVDGQGYRLGYGGGYYDRILSELREGEGFQPLAIAVCFACQLVEAVPHDNYDQPVDWVVTENGAQRVS